MPADVVTAPQENRKPGENPGRYRRCMRGGCALDESRSLGKPEKAVWSLGCASQKNCLNEVKTLGSASTEPVLFCCGKTAAAVLFWAAAAFCFFCAPTEYCLLVWQGDPVRIRNNRPLLC